LNNDTLQIIKKKKEWNGYGKAIIKIFPRGKWYQQRGTKKKSMILIIYQTTIGVGSIHACYDSMRGKKGRKSNRYMSIVMQEIKHLSVSVKR